MHVCVIWTNARESAGNSGGGGQRERERKGDIRDGVSGTETFFDVGRERERNV